MSTLKADTIQSPGGGAVTLTNQVALKANVKVSSAASLTAAGCFNISSATDHGTGDFSFGITNAYSSVNHYVQTCIQEGASHGHGGTRNTGRHSASVIAVETFNSSGSLVSIASNILTAGDLA